MNHPAHKQYGFEDIKRYLNGAMNPAEKYELERAALQDPFLSDALEGFEIHGTTSYGTHEQEITNTILQARDVAPIVPILKRRSWMRIAALFILITGVGILGYQNFRPGKNEAVTQQHDVTVQQDAMPESTLPEAKKKLSDTELSLPQATEKNSIKNNDIGALNFKEQQNAQPNFSPQQMEADAAIITANDTDISASKSNDEANADIATNRPYKSKEMVSNSDSIISLMPSNTIEEQLTGKVAGVQVGTDGYLSSRKITNVNTTLQGIVTDEAGKPIANVSVISADKKNVGITDMQGRFSLVTKDSSKDATVAAVGYLTAQVKLSNQASQNKFVLTPNASTLSEVVVTSLGISRDKKTLNYTSNKPEAALQPVGGWESFHEYVRIKLGMDSLEYYSEIPGEEMTIEFALDKDGNPSNVQILSAGGSEKADVVKRIIETGPRWTKPEKRRKVRTTIPR